jgi:hypothetical protein
MKEEWYWSGVDGCKMVEMLGGRKCLLWWE